MNKVLGVALTLLLSSFAQAKPLFSEYKTTLLEVNDKEGLIQDSPSFIVGSSGIVMHTFDAKASTIIVRFDVIKKENGKATVRFEPFRMLAQGAFPDTGVKPTVGDSVIVNYLYDRSLLIAPNQTTYNEISKKPLDIAWVHPDIVAAYLTKLYKPNPDKAVFQQACYQNTASMITFAIKDKAYFVDCHNFNIIHIMQITPSTETQLPFYSRIKNIDSSLFNWGSSHIADYNNYYEYLLGQTASLKDTSILSKDGIILNLPFTIVEKKDTLWK